MYINEDAHYVLVNLIPEIKAGKNSSKTAGQQYKIRDELFVYQTPFCPKLRKLFVHIFLRLPHSCLCLTQRKPQRSRKIRLIIMVFAVFPSTCEVA